jgi:hypothetical protein
MKTTAEIQSELNTLQSELKSLELRSAEIDALQIILKTEKQNLCARVEALTGINRWRGKSIGLIDKAELKLLESQRPIYDATDSRVRRIISVNEKWIELKCDSQSLDTSTKYSRYLGWKMRARDDYGAIDVIKAMEIWNK